MILLDETSNWEELFKHARQKKVNKQMKYWGIIEEVDALFLFRTIFIQPKFDHWPPLPLTDYLTHSCWVDLTDVTLAFEEAILKLLDVVSAERVDDSLVEILKLRCSQLLTSCLRRSARIRGSGHRISDREHLEFLNLQAGPFSYNKTWLSYEKDPNYHPKRVMH